MLNIRKCEEEQKRLAPKGVLRDDFSGIKGIGGAEAYIVDGKAMACVVVCDASTLEVKEKAFASGIIGERFMPEFRAYREGPLLGEALSALQKKPDVMIFSGDGVLHPRRIGLAAHLGVLFDIPSLGVAREPLCGETKGGFVYLDGEKLAQLVKTREHANPVCVSPGHRMSLATAASLVKGSIREPHKMPEPLHLAHKFAKKELNAIRKPAYSNSKP